MIPTLPHDTDASSFKVVIPARYGSTRLPGKPLKIIAEKPMIQWVYENAMAAGADEVLIATDDQRIVEAADKFGAKAFMTSALHRSGTDRISEVCTACGWSPDTIVVNLQGDEPGIPPSLIVLVARALRHHKEAGIATVATPIYTNKEFTNPNVVKVVLDNAQFAMYFSRSPIPYARDYLGSLQSDSSSSCSNNASYLRHLGLYAYRVAPLKRISAQEPSGPERLESLEQLRAMSMGIKIHVSVIDEAPGHGVDTAEDLEKVQALLSNNSVDASS